MSAHEHFGGAIRQGEAPPAEALDAALRQPRSLVLLEADREAWHRTLEAPEEKRRIDVWWNDDATSRPCLLLAHLMTRSDGWRDAQEMLAEARIDAEPDAIDYEDPALLVEHSRDASLVFLPLRMRGRRLVGPKGLALTAALDELPMTALVMAAEDIRLDHDADDAEAAENSAEDAATPPASRPAPV